ncbi:MAG: hypothetical protein V2A54_13105 [Bacteroidota bacterium]
MNLTKSLITLFFFSLIVTSCKKDKFIPYPTVTFIKPSQNQVFDYNDTVQLSISVTSEDQIEEAKLYLADQNLQPVGPAASWFPNAKEATLTCEYPLTDLSIAGGAYTFLLQITTENNNKNYFRAVDIAPMPRLLLGILAVVKKASTTYEVQLSQDGISFQPVFTFSGDYGGSVVNSSANLFLKYGEIISDAVAYSAPGWLNQWTVQASASPPFPFYTGIYSNLTDQYLGYFDGTSRGYDKNGTHFFSANCPTGFYPKLMLRNDPWFITVDYAKSGTDRNISLYNYSTRVLQTSLVISESPLAMHSRNDDEVFLFSNKNGNAVLKMYHIVTNSISTPYTMPALPLRDVTQVDNNNYLLLFDSKIEWYNWSSTSMVPFKTIAGYRLKYEDISQKVIVASGKSVHILSFPYGQTVNSIPLSDTIVGLHLLYNK